MPATRPATRDRGTATTVTVAHSPRAVHEVREQLRAELLDAGVDGVTVENAEIVLAELLGNAVRHARPLPDGTLTVSWRLRDGVVDVTVTDGGSPMVVARRTPLPLATGGRGLQIVSALARAWGVVDIGRGRTVWAALVPTDIWAFPAL